MSDSTQTPQDPAPDNVVPFLRVVKGEPDAVELAAVIAVLATRSGTAAPVEPKRIGGWASKAALLRPAVAHGPGAWAASARQR